MELSLWITLLIMSTATVTANVGDQQQNQPSYGQDKSDVNDLPDFNFDKSTKLSELSGEFVYPDDETVRLDDVEETVGDDRTNFINRERKIRQVLTAALTNVQMKRKFSEVIPMLRLMTQAQRLTLAALIQAQVAGNQELTLEQVKTFFGDREELILPLILDIANLIKIAGNRAHEPYLENEVTPTYQSLRRSFFHATPFKRPVAEAQKSSNEDDETQESAAKVVEITQFVNSHQHDDTLSVDEDEVIVKDNNGNVRDDLDGESSNYEQVYVEPERSKNTVDSIPIAQRRDMKQGRSFDVVRAERLIQQPINEEKLALSYHERKFNMSAFNATKTHLDQEAMASDHEGIFSVALPDDVSHNNNNARNMTLDELEDLVMRSLQGDAENFEDNERNQTTESLPTPEQLIAYKRLRPKGKRPPPNRKFSPVVSNDDCEILSGPTICLLVKNYPMEQIMRSIRRHKHAMGSLLVDFKQRESISGYDDHFERSSIITKRQDDVHNTGQMCDSIVRFARPQKARSATGEWKYVVNTGTHTQTLRLEKCSTPDDSCAYLTDNYRSRCIQIYNYHRLLSWDAQRGLHVDIFKVPTCCSCHIDGYKEAFPPLSEYDSYGHLDLEDDGHQSASGSKYRYSTLRDSLKDFDPIEEEEEDFFYSNGYTKRKMKPSSSSSSKHKYERTKSPPIDAYLSPPVSSYEPTYSFGSRYPSKTRSRRPTANRKQITDQLPAGSDFQPNEVTVLPPRTLNDHRVRLAPSIASTVNSTVNIKLPNADAPKRIINYNYHPIIDFFGKENENKSRERDGVDRIGNVVERQSSWRPMINRRG